MALIEINRNPGQRELRSFAWLWFPLFCAAVSLLVWWRAGVVEVAYAMGAVAVVVAVCAVAAPAVVRLVFVGLIYLTFPIGFIISHVLIGLVYYGVFTPVGLVMRAFGWDAMTRKLDRKAQTYWVKLPPAPAKERYFRQY